MGATITGAPCRPHRCSLGVFTPRAQPWSKTPNMYHVLGPQPGQALTKEFREVHRTMHADKLARMPNKGLDEAGSSRRSSRNRSIVPR
eukprot:5123373-Pyramimonas_sp.AAC.1